MGRFEGVSLFFSLCLFFFFFLKTVTTTRREGARSFLFPGDNSHEAQAAAAVSRRHIDVPGRWAKRQEADSDAGPSFPTCLGPYFGRSG